MPDEIEPEGPSLDYVKGFNEGYLLSKHAPEIAYFFDAHAPDSERGQGLRKGKEQYASEMTKEPYPDFLKEVSKNKTDMGLKDSPEKKMADFRESKKDLGLDKNKYPDWMQEKDENKSDMGIDRVQDREKDDIEPEL